MKLALGTVQLGYHYGVANTIGKLSSFEATKILKLALDSGINTLDTAIEYGESESVLGHIGVSSWKVVSKLPAVPIECNDIYTWVRLQVQGSLNRLKQKSLYGLLLHRPEQLLGPKGADLHFALLSLKSEKLVKKVGVSVYSPDELESLFNAYPFDLVQAPLNILDRRLVESGWVSQLKRENVELHTRSTFLQGLLLMPPHARPTKFHAWTSVWRVWDQWLAETGLTPLQACLFYLNAISDVDRVIVGIDSHTQLHQIVAAATGKLTNLPDFPSLHDERLINPASWQL